MKNIISSAVIFIVIVSCQHNNKTVIDVEESEWGINSTLVLIDNSTHKILYEYNQKIANHRVAPCSTFKIWNTLIANECGIISNENEIIYKWDGKERSIKNWNKDLSLKEAFQVSCVPAFQDIAFRINPERMQHWINYIDYGDKNINAGIKLFWLPEKNRKTILISPKEQAILLDNLISNNLNFSAESIHLLKNIMKSTVTNHGTLYGKTGSVTNEHGNYIMGWYVGFIESKDKVIVFAALINGENITGKHVKEKIEKLFIRYNLL